MNEVKLLAQVEQKLGKIGGEYLGPFGNTAFTGEGAIKALASGVSSIIGIMTIAAGIWFIFQFLIGGFYWITSTGDKAKLETAHHRINDAFVGLIIVVAGWAILALAAQFFNVDFLLSDPATLRNLLQFKP